MFKSLIMKTILLLTIFILFGFTSFAQDLKALDNKYGFQEAKFEMPPSSLENLIPINALGDGFPDLKFYYKTNLGESTIGSSYIKRIWYQFYQDQLYEIKVDPDAHSDPNEILGILETAYGKSRLVKKMSSTQCSYIWEGEKVSLFYYINKDSSALSLICKKFYPLVEASIKLANKQKIQNAAKKDL